MSGLSEPSKKRLLSLEFLLQQELAGDAGKTASGSGDSEGQQLKKESGTTITSRRLAQLTGWTDATIRRDISQLGIRCGSSNGYPIEELQQAIAQALGSSSNEEASHRCCIVGLGKIGAALLDYDGFASAGFQLVAGFDQSVNRVELLNASFPLYPASRLEQVIGQESIQYAILTVPDTVAVDYGKRLAEAGIKGIVNYTNSLLSVPSTVKVENISVVHSLRQLVARNILRNK
ncbi:MAG: redox-sensing transcriptional repressor Rex [Spirochaetaceae bacterium]|nr:redox-sensing transcriptional repressor Rex [Spirochaetaceae bacterium]